MKSQARRVTVETKPWWQSKILWTQIGLITLAVFAAPEFLAIVPPHVLPYIAALAAVITIIFRILSTNPVGPGAERASRR